MNPHMNEMRSKTNPNKAIKTDYSSYIKKLQMKEENSACFDCGCKGTTYYVLNFGTFVCSKCAGILRELGFKVKGISVSLFSEEEKNHAEMMGNAKAKKVWMGLYSYKSNSRPKNQNEFKNHLKDKYIYKKYFKKNKDIKKVRFDSDESDSDSDSDPNQVNNNDAVDHDDSNEDEESEDEDEEGEESEEGESEDEDKVKGEAGSKVKEYSKENYMKKEKEKEKEHKMTPITLIKLKKPHNKMTSESMKFSKKAWEDLWEKADLTTIKQASINDFEFFDKDNDSINITNTNHNTHTHAHGHDLLLFNSNNEPPIAQNPINLYQPNSSNHQSLNDTSQKDN